jgi:tetratricopeptide (TPR) repeat protein
MTYVRGHYRQTSEGQTWVHGHHRGGGGGGNSDVPVGPIIALLVGVAALIVAPFFMWAVWLVWELAGRDRVHPRGPEAFALTPEEIEKLREAEARLTGATASCEALEGESHGYARRNDGRLDERSRRAKEINEELDAATREKNTAHFDVLVLESLPDSRFEEWSKGRHNLWGVRLGAAACTLTFIAVLLSGATRWTPNLKLSFLEGILNTLTSLVEKLPSGTELVMLLLPVIVGAIAFAIGRGIGADLTAPFNPTPPEAAAVSPDAAAPAAAQAAPVSTARPPAGFGVVSIIGFGLLTAALIALVVAVALRSRNGVLVCFPLVLAGMPMALRRQSPTYRFGGGFLAGCALLAAGAMMTPDEGAKPEALVAADGGALVEVAMKTGAEPARAAAAPTATRAGACPGYADDGEPVDCPKIELPKQLYKIGNEAGKLVKQKKVHEGNCVAMELIRRARADGGKSAQLHMSIGAYNLAGGLRANGCKELACAWVRRSLEWRRASHRPELVKEQCSRIREWECGETPEACDEPEPEPAEAAGAEPERATEGGSEDSAAAKAREVAARDVTPLKLTPPKAPEGEPAAKPEAPAKTPPADDDDEDGARKAAPPRSPAAEPKTVAPVRPPPTGTPIERAREHARRGAEAYQKRQWAAAVTEYQAAQALVPHPANLLNIGNAYYFQKDRPHALEYYQRYLRADPNGRRSAETRGRVERLKGEGE